MSTEVLSKRFLISEASKALSGLDEVKIISQEERSEVRTGYLEQALDNLHFVEDNISNVVGDFFAKTQGRMNFGYHTLSFFGEVPIMFNAQEDKGQLSYAFDPGRKPARLTEDLIKRLWNANINRNAVKAFGSLSKEQIIERFQSHIISSIK